MAHSPLGDLWDPSDDMSPLAPLDDMLLSSSNEMDQTDEAADTAPQPRARGRRQALSSEDSPRAPGVAMPMDGVKTEVVGHNTPLAPMQDMLDTPRTSARFIAAKGRPKMINTSAESELRPGDFDNLGDVHMSMMDERDGKNGSSSSAFRRNALSGMDSPRAPKQHVPDPNDIDTNHEFLGNHTIHSLLTEHPLTIVLGFRSSGSQHSAPTYGRDVSNTP